MDHELIDIPEEISSRDMILGQVVQAVNNLTKTVDDFKESNQSEHKEFSKRLEEGDQYLFIFKLSRCAVSWLDRQGAIKGALLVFLFLLTDWISRYLYWDFFSKP